MQNRIDEARNERRRNLWEFLTIFRGDGHDFRDIARALGYQSLGTVSSDIYALEEAGYISRPNMGARRAITVVIPFISLELATC